MENRRDDSRPIRLLITGKNSFIGRSVAERLKDDPGFGTAELDMHGDAWRTFDFSAFDSVLHVAGIAHVSPDPSLAEQYRKVNFELAVETAKRARECGVKQFVFMSSMIVFGAAAPAGVRRTIAPDTDPQPENAYGQSKLDAEKALLALENDHFRVAILRPPMVYGPGCKGNYNALVKLARMLPVFPDFDNRRSMIYVGNLAECIRCLALTGEGGVFHPQDERPRSVTEIVRAICAAHGKKMYFTRLLNPLVRLLGRGGIARRAFGDMVYAPELSETPFEYRVCDFETAIKRTEEGGAPWQA